MLRKVILWFITYGLSCILSNIFRGLGQGQIFFYIYAGTPIILLTFEMFSATKVIGLLAEIVGENEIADAASGRITLFMAIEFAINFIVVLIAVLGVTVLFKINFLVAYQIITLGKCICANQIQE